MMTIVADFTQRVYGVDFHKALDAINEFRASNRAPVRELIESTAQNLETSPETAKELMVELHGHLLQDMGIKVEEL